MTEELWRPSILVTDVGDGFVIDSFEVLVTDSFHWKKSLNCLHWNVTNITLSPNSVSPHYVTYICDDSDVTGIILVALWWWPIQIIGGRISNLVFLSPTHFISNTRHQHRWILYSLYVHDKRYCDIAPSCCWIIIVCPTTSTKIRS